MTTSSGALINFKPVDSIRPLSKHSHPSPFTSHTDHHLHPSSLPLISFLNLQVTTRYLYKPTQVNEAGKAQVSGQVRSVRIEFDVRVWGVGLNTSGHNEANWKTVELMRYAGTNTGIVQV